MPGDHVNVELKFCMNMKKRGDPLQNSAGGWTPDAPVYGCQIHIDTLLVEPSMYWTVFCVFIGRIDHYLLT